MEKETRPGLMQQATIPVYIVSDDLLSPLASGTEAHVAHLKAGQSGIRLHDNPLMAPSPFYAALFDNDSLPENMPAGFTRFEWLLTASIKNALTKTTVDLRDSRTVLILSSTKGNISLLETAAGMPDLQDQLTLHASAKKMAAHFQYAHLPVIVSNACISGLLALLMGLRLIRSGQYDHAVVAGCDVISKFVLSGFQSFQAISPEPCKPFDAGRNGITLGEAAATVVLSRNNNVDGNAMQLVSGSVSNDANHISGPSRTGEELHMAIQTALRDAGLTAADIGFISAHGTATIYNDEMEAKALSLSGLETVPVNSLKGNFGHTLGAAGLVESVVSLAGLRSGIVFPTKGFNRSGVSKPLNICSILQPVTANHFLKTASGFGGCNAALVFSR